MNKKFSKTFYCVLTAIVLLTSTAVCAAAPREVIRAGFFAFDGYHEIDQNGIRSGYGYEFLRLISRYIDVDFEYVGYQNSWEDMSEMLENGEIDMVTSAQFTAERNRNFDFSKPIGTSNAILTVKSNNSKIVAYDYSTYNGMRVGLLEGNSRNDDFKKYAAEKGFTYTPVYFEMHTDLEKALQDGKVDAVVTSSLRKTTGERVLDSFAAHDFYVMVRNGSDDLLQKINYAIDQLNAVEGDWQNNLTMKYYTHADARDVSFTEREKEIIRQYAEGEKTLVITGSMDRKPYTYVENGELRGIIADYFKLLADYAGIPYKVVVPSSREEYEKSQKDGSVDVFIDSRIPSDTWLEENGFSATAPYTVMRLATVTRRDFDGTAKTIAVAEAQGLSGIEEGLVQDAKKITVPTREDAMIAVRDGKADMCFVYLYTAQEFVNRDGTGTLTYTMLENPTYNYHIGFTKNVNHELSGIFTKCIYAMPEHTFENIAAEYTAYKAANITMAEWIRIHPRVAIGLSFLFFLLITFSVLYFERKRRVKRLNEAVEKAEKANRAKSEFLANVSHDIRTPMNAIVGISALMEQERDVPEKIKEYIKRIRRSSNHLLGLINDVLDMSKIESGEMEIVPEPIMLYEQVEQTDDMVRAQAIARGQTLDVRFHNISHKYLVADGTHLRQVLINILSNAVKYTQNGGKIWFDIEELPCKNKDKAKLRFSVTDNGSGMTPEVLKRIFEPFSRGEASVTNKIQGTGLGLAITKNIVELMDGTIEVTSNPQKGTRVVVTMNMDVDKKAEKFAEKEPARQNNEKNTSILKKTRFLCAEDNELNAEILEELLKAYNATCKICGDGEELVKVFSEAEENEFDVILTDIQMPKMNGLDAARAIRDSSNPRGKTIPIIAMTANAFDEDIRRSLDAGMDAHIAKPIDIVRLEQAVGSVLKKAKNKQNTAMEGEQQ